MKKCPYCAEEIQDEAILCRYCKGNLEKDTTAQKTNNDYYAILEKRIEELLIQFKDLSDKDKKNYPLSINRRPGAIVNFVKYFEEGTKEEWTSNTAGCCLYWMLGAYEEQADEMEQVLAGALSNDTSKYDYTNDEVLMGTALVLLRASDEKLLDQDFSMIDVYQKGLRAGRRARFIRGFSLFGAVANILSSPKFKFKEGSTIWHIMRRAYAETEARAIYQSVKETL